MAQHLPLSQGKRLLELGAGNSRYLPGLAKRFGLVVAGLDYSPLGVDLAQRNLAEAGIEAQVVEADLFDPPDGWERAFDIVMTMGVVEHFDDTASVIRAAARYLAPRGWMLTVIPNMNGLPGATTNWLSRQLYDRHIALTPRELAAAHTAAGMAVRRAQYLVGFDGWIANPGASPSRWKRWLYNPVLAMTRVVWVLEDRVGLIRPNRITSPWVAVIAETQA